MCRESGFEINEDYFMLCGMDSPKGGDGYHVAYVALWKVDGLMSG